jgi:hypothetical protein
MSNPNYTLEIISHHPKFNSKALKKYYVDGIETVGAWGDEPFEVRFKNNTWQKVQVKISVDGTDVLSGKPADTLVSNDMWVVNGYATLSLKAWPEDNNGGAGFVFTSAEKSVALHTHGDLSNRGIIACAVFTEGHVEPVKINFPTRIEEHHHHYPPYVPYTPPVYPWPNVKPYEPIWIYNTSTNTGSDMRRGLDYKSSNVIPNSTNGTFGSTSTSTSSNCIGSMDAISDSFYLSDSDGAPAAAAGLETLVSVGAGEHVDQKITYVTGLIKPLFAETVRVKYIWWDDLVEKLRTHTKAEAQPSGFPGDRDRKNIDLKGTPRIGKKGSVRRVEEQRQQVFDRF